VVVQKPRGQIVIKKKKWGDAKLNESKSVHGNAHTRGASTCGGIGKKKK